MPTNKKEIGGYFGLEQLINKEYYKDLIPLNNGRNALLYILNVRNIKKLYIPYYLCNSVSDMCTRNGFDFDYYNVDAEFMPIFNKYLADGEYMYVVNYYGQLTNKRVQNLKYQFKQIILDNTQAFFQKPLEGIDTIYSCRKFFGVPDGAYLFSNAECDLELAVDISRGRMDHLLGRHEGIASDYYSYFLSNDASFKTERLKFMSKLTHNILGAIDYERVRRTRNQNYAYLESKLGEQNQLKLITPDGAYAYPYYVENGTATRRVLMLKKIYIPTLWPNVLTDLSDKSIGYRYAMNILPLPCDQRYDTEDMEFMVKELF